MSNVVISVENLSKEYRLGQIGTGTLSRDINVWWAKVRGKPNPMLRLGESDHGNRDGESLWALKDVSFTVEQGDTLGIIGRNGAGKSTLLKILSRVTAPTRGRVKVKGRIASLLEVGTGFHPDLTGRENTYLNGAILGMTRQEVRRKLDEIVAFAEIEKFIDTPVKRYSSGMYVRLAFAVAAHLDPEILVVDEVLAVGDAEFQKKCLGKMSDVASEGRTVLFVSHNMGAINTLCAKGVLLKNGSILMLGDSSQCIKRYLETNASLAGTWSLLDNSVKKDAFFESISVVDSNGNISGVVKSNAEFLIDVKIFSTKQLHAGQIHIRLNNDEGIPVFTTSNTDIRFSSDHILEGENRYNIKIPANFLRSGNYFISSAILIPNAQIFDHLDTCLSFSVQDSGSHATQYGNWRQGVVVPLFTWEKMN